VLGASPLAGGTLSAPSAGKTPSLEAPGVQDVGAAPDTQSTTGLLGIDVAEEGGRFRILRIYRRRRPC